MGTSCTYGLTYNIRIVAWTAVLWGFFLPLSAQENDPDDLFQRYGEIYVSVQGNPTYLMKELGADFVVSGVTENQVELCLNPTEYRRFLRRNYSYKLLIPEIPKAKYMAANMEEARLLYYYPTYPQYVALMQSYASNYPELARLDTIGETPNGHLVLALRMASAVALENPVPKVFFSASMHGNETPCYPMMLRLADTLLRAYSESAPIRELLDSAIVYINPLANPDGMFRHYDTTILDASRYNSQGKDLNRHFPDPSFSPSFVPTPENIDMIAFMRKHRFALSANFHTGFTVLNYPYDRTYTPHADRDWFHYICRGYADTAHTLDPGYMTRYDNGVVQGSDWFVVRGSRQDFITYYLQGREVTVELDGTKLSTPERAAELWELNKASLVYYLRQVLYGIQGIVYDAENGDPVAARIKVQGHDTDSSHIYSDSTSGFYARFLAEGSWDLEVTAGGYRDTLIEGISVENHRKTLLHLPMKKLSTSVPALLQPEKPVVYPNPASHFFMVSLPVNIPAGELRVYDITGCLVSSHSFRGGQNNLKVAVTEWPAGVYMVQVYGAGTLYAAGKVIIPGR